MWTVSSDVSIQYNNKVTNILVDWLLSVYNKRGSVDQVFLFLDAAFFSHVINFKTFEYLLRFASYQLYITDGFSRGSTAHGQLCQPLWIKM